MIGGRFGGRSVRGGRGFNRDSADNENYYGNNNGFNECCRPSEDGDVEKASARRVGYGGPRGGYRGGRRRGYTNCDAPYGKRPRRVFECHSGTGRGNEVKREGVGHGIWGTGADEIAVSRDVKDINTIMNLEVQPETVAFETNLIEHIDANGYLVTNGSDIEVDKIGDLDYRKRRIMNESTWTPCGFL